MRHEEPEINGQTKGIEEFNTELERRRGVLSQIEGAVKSATKREQVMEQLRRISEETRFVHQLSGFSSSLQTAAAILNLIRENSRLYNLATRKLAELDQKSTDPFQPTAQTHRPPAG